ncbi:MAG: PIG-L deacetylase family protein [Actinomycetota bacterium]
MTDEFDYQKVLVFCPHPDDGEVTAGGSMARWASEGKEVILCVATNGAAGSNDPEVDRDELIATREREQRAAAEITGISDVIFLGHEDGFLEDSHELRLDLIREIRRYKPDVVMGPDPTSFYFAQRYINHPDHRKLGESVCAAVNPGATTVPLYRPELHDQGFEAHSLKGCLLAFSNQPDFFVDISDFIEVKLKALQAHASQFQDPERLEGLVRMMGKMSAGASNREMEYAEGYKSFFFDRDWTPEADS